METLHSAAVRAVATAETGSFLQDPVAQHLNHLCRYCCGTIRIVPRIRVRIMTHVPEGSQRT